MNQEPVQDHAASDSADGPIASGDAAEHYVLTLFVSGMTRRSVEAVAAVKGLCEAHLFERYDLDVVDIYLHPEAASFHQIVAVPTLMRSRPEPIRRLIGDLSDTGRVLRGLGLEAPL